MNIKGKFVTLRAIERSDMEFMKEMMNDDYIEDKVVGWSFPISSLQQERWYENSIGNSTQQRYIVETPEDGPVGLATLINIDWKNRHAEHGIKLAHRDFRGKGIGTDTVMAIMRYAFDELQMVRLEGAWFAENTASKGLYEKCGWREEGCKRNYIFKKGKFRDLYVTGILAEEYYELIERNHYWDE